MAVQPNLVVGAVGLVLALSTGSYIGTNWGALTDVQEYEGILETLHMDLPERGRTLNDNDQGSEIYFVPDANVTLLSVSLTWQASVLSQPEVTLRVIDPGGVLRGMATHTGGVTGIQVDIQLISPKDQPSDTSFRFQARSAEEARATFERHWANHTESRGNWTYEISSRSPSGAGSLFYTLSVEYDYYTATFEPAVRLVK